MTFRTDIELKFSEMKNTSYADYAEQARVAFLAHVGIAEECLRLARIALDFKRFTRYLDNVYVETCVEQVGRSSITLRHLIYSNGHIGALGNIVVVHVDDKEEPQYLPKSIREKLEPYLI